MYKVYLDHHTTTRPFSHAIEALLAAHREHWGDTTAPHHVGQELFPVLKESLETIYQEIGANTEDRFYFCSSGAEAINSALFSHYLDTFQGSKDSHIVTINTEQAPILMGFKRLESLGCFEMVAPVDLHGQITPSALEQVIRPDTGLISLSWANGLTGVIQPIAEIAMFCQKKGIRLHVDASYVIGKIPFRFADLPIDFLSFEGRLIHSPKGTGGLFVKASSLPFHPLILGDSGENPGGINALAAALDEGSSHMDHLNLETARLRDKLERGIQAGFPEARIFFQDTDRLPNCTAIGFHGVANDALAYLLHRQGVYASLGGGQNQKLSHILIASGVNPVLAQSSLSFSLSYETTEEQIDHAIKIIVSCAHQLRACSKEIL